MNSLQYSRDLFSKNLDALMRKLRQHRCRYPLDTLVNQKLARSLELLAEIQARRPATREEIGLALNQRQVD